MEPLALVGPSLRTGCQFIIPALQITYSLCNKTCDLIQFLPTIEINGFTIAFAVLHLIALARWRPPWQPLYVHSHVTTDSHVGNKGSWAFTVNCSRIIHSSIAFIWSRNAICTDCGTANSLFNFLKPDKKFKQLKWNAPSTFYLINNISSMMC